MRPFKFRLAGVLAIWQRREETSLALLQWESAKTAQARVEKDELEAKRHDARLAADRALADGREGHDPAWHRNWIIRLAADVQAARERVRLTEARETTARAAWQRARRDRRVIERLQERAKTRHESDRRRADTKDVDELAGRQVLGGHRW